LSALGTGLGIAAETRIDAGKNKCETDDKNRIKISLCPLSHFIDHLVDVLGNNCLRVIETKKPRVFLIQ
jgi:hypothetical protein